VKAASEAVATPKKDEALPLLRQVVDIYKLDLEDGATADDLAGWMTKIHPTFDAQKYGFQSFGEFLNFAQDSYLVRVEADPARGLIAYPGAEMAPPPARQEEVIAAGASVAAPVAGDEEPLAEAAAESPAAEPEEEGEKPKRGGARKRTPAKKAAANGSTAVRRPRARKPVE
jgi:hypothetical protein